MKVFIIDDDHLSIFLTQQILLLEDASLEISSYLSSPEALEVLLNADKAELPDLVLLDLNMPLLDGWELLDRLAPEGAKLSNGCQFFILTSSLDTSDTERAKEYELVSGFLHKPIMIEDVQVILSGLNVAGIAN